MRCHCPYPVTGEPLVCAFLQIVWRFSAREAPERTSEYHGSSLFNALPSAAFGGVSDEWAGSEVCPAR